MTVLTRRLRGRQVESLDQARSRVDACQVQPWIVVVTVDQRASRTGPDLVEALLADLNDPRRAPTRVLDFERTAGDEVQGVIDDPAALPAMT